MAPSESGDQISLEEAGAASDQLAPFLSGSPSGVLLVPTSLTGRSDDLALPSETYPFAKWVRRSHPEIPINVGEASSSRELRSGDIWLPLAFLATDVTLPIFLNLVANYLYDRLRGRLQHDVPTVHVEVLFQDGSLTKRFFYKGSVAGLQASIKKLDLDKIANPPHV